MNRPPAVMQAQVIRFIYENHRGETAVRTAIPIELRWKKIDPYYPVETWLLHCWDLDKDSWRDFALCKMKDIKG